MLYGEVSLIGQLSLLKSTSQNVRAFLEFCERLGTRDKPRPPSHRKTRWTFRFEGLEKEWTGQK